MNQKSTSERAQILTLLCEGNSLRSTSRIAGVSINTVTKLLEMAGEACSAYQDAHIGGLESKRLQIDEIWSFVGAKQKNVKPEHEIGWGDQWTFTCIDADSKLIVGFMVGERNACDAQTFLEDVKKRLAGRVQLTTDGHKMYLTAMEAAFGADADFAQLVKHYSTLAGNTTAEARYSPGQCCGATKEKIEGNPDMKHVSTSFVERQNLTIRMSNRRFTRLTNAFSKKLANHIHSLALHFMHYNFVRLHKTLKTTPAMAAGVTDSLWEMEHVVEMIDAYWAKKKAN